MDEQIFPDGVDPSKFVPAGPGRWQDPASGTVFYTGTGWTPPAPGPTLTVTTITVPKSGTNQSGTNQSATSQNGTAVNG